MNALTGIENLIKQPAILNCPYWAAYRDKVSDQNRLRDNYNTEASLEVAEKGLRDFCNDMQASGCNVEFWFSETAKPNKGGYRVPFYMPASNGAINHNIGMGASPEDIEARVQKRMEELFREQRLKALEEENRELRQEIEGTPLTRVLNRVAGSLEPYMPQIIANVFPGSQQPQLAGTTTDNQKTEEMNKKEQEQVEKALTILADKRKDLPDLLEKLAKLAQDKPGVFDMAVQSLNSL